MSFFSMIWSFSLCVVYNVRCRHSLWVFIIPNLEDLDCEQVQRQKLSTKVLFTRDVKPLIVCNCEICESSLWCDVMKSLTQKSIELRLVLNFQTTTHKKEGLNSTCNTYSKQRKGWSAGRKHSLSVCDWLSVSSVRDSLLGRRRQRRSTTTLSCRAVECVPQSVTTIFKSTEDLPSWSCCPIMQLIEWNSAFLVSARARQETSLSLLRCHAVVTVLTLLCIPSSSRSDFIWIT